MYIFTSAGSSCFLFAMPFLYLGHSFWRLQGPFWRLCPSAPWNYTPIFRKWYKIQTSYLPLNPIQTGTVQLWTTLVSKSHMAVSPPVQVWARQSRESSLRLNFLGHCFKIMLSWCSPSVAHLPACMPLCIPIPHRMWLAFSPHGMVWR